MADSKDTEEVEVEERPDEPEEVEEETAEEDSEEQSEDEDSEDEESEEESDDSEDDESEEVPFKKRFTQFKGETPEEYLSELEEAYANSQAEYERLRQGKTEEPKEETGEPTDSYGYDLWAQQTEREYKEFSDENEKFRTDEEVRKDVIENYLPVVAAVFKKKHGYNISMKQGLEQAFKAAGYSEEGDSVSVKKNASSPRANSKRTKKPEPTGISKKQIEVARKVDPSLEGKSDSEVSKALAKALK